ncbi:MAG: hypothetical protein PVSMB7_27490 [Chloroflexota bacterium]
MPLRASHVHHSGIAGEGREGVNTLQHSGRGPTMIVVVDDEPDVRDMVCALLEDEGYFVLCLSHPVQATTLYAANPRPRLFLLDIMLPDMNGIMLAERLASNGFAETPKIAMSASAQMLRMAEQSNLFHAIVGKPFDLDELLNHIEHFHHG